MDAMQPQRPELWERQLPDPRRIRVLMGSFVMLGACLAVTGALVQLWAQNLRLSPPALGNTFLALGLGSTVAPMGAFRKSPLRGVAVRRLFLLAGLLAAGSFLWLSRIVQAFWILPPVLLLGGALGVLNVAIAVLLQGTLTRSRTSTVLELAGVFFSGGALLTCVLLWLLSERAGLGTMLWLLAALALLSSWLISRSSLFQFTVFRRDSAGLWNQLDLSPKSVLLFLAMFLESGTYWTVGGWLALYMARKFGTAGSTSLEVLAAFWLALTAGRVAAQRLPALEKRLRWLLASSGLCLAGSVFLIQTADVSGAAAGALFLGAGLGLLHPLTMGAITGRHPYPQTRMLHAFFLLNVSAALLIPWGVGHLATGLGIEIVVWTALASGIVVFLLLGIVVIESKLDERSATAA